MKFIVSSGALQKNLQNIIGIISSNNIIPILEDFLFQIKKDEITISATDLETFMKVSVEAQTNEEGSICIPAKVLLDYLKNMPEQPITFDINDNYGIEITSNYGKSKLVGESDANFPKEPTIDAKTTFLMSAAELSDGISKALVAVSSSDARPAMSGVYFEMANDSITFVSTDAHRLVRCIKTNVECPKEDSFIVPKKALVQLKNTLSQSSEVSLSYDKNLLSIEGEKLHMICRLIDAKFPDYKTVIPADNPFKLTVNLDDFSSSLRRVSLFSNKTTNQVALDIVGNSLDLYASDVDLSHESDEKMNCQYNGEDMKIAFNAKLLLELTQILQDEEITFELSTPSRAGIIKQVQSEENEDLLILIMPLMMN